VRLSRLRHARKVTFDICHENGNPQFRKTFRQYLQGDSFTGTGRTGNQAMPIAHAGVHYYLFSFAATYE
jgi:hypothetical protein